MKFNEKLISLRKSIGISQEELGEKLNVTRQTISKWELGETTPEMEKLIALSSIFKVSIDELVGNSSEENINSSDKETRKGYFEYKSKTFVKGIPLVHVNIGFRPRKAKGIIAIGNIAQGIISIGAIAMGLISLGGVSLGILSLGGVALGLLAAIGGIAIGTFALGAIAIGIISIGGVAIGLYSIGGLSIAKNVSAGGYAIGDIAIGKTTNGNLEFIIKDGIKNFSDSDLKNAIASKYPNISKILLDIFTNIRIN